MHSASNVLGNGHVLCRLICQKHLLHQVLFLFQVAVSRMKGYAQPKWGVQLSGAVTIKFLSLSFTFQGGMLISGDSNGEVCMSISL
jgi:hypothetical protein